MGQCTLSKAGQAPALSAGCGIGDAINIRSNCCALVSLLVALLALGSEVDSVAHAREGSSYDDMGFLPDGVHGNEDRFVHMNPEPSPDVETTIPKKGWAARQNNLPSSVKYDARLLQSRHVTMETTSNAKNRAARRSRGLSARKARSTSPGQQPKTGLRRAQSIVTTRSGDRIGARVRGAMDAAPPSSLEQMPEHLASPPRIYRTTGSGDPTPQRSPSRSQPHNQDAENITFLGLATPGPGKRKRAAKVNRGVNFSE